MLIDRLGIARAPRHVLFGVVSAVVVASANPGFAQVPSLAIPNAADASKIKPSERIAPVQPAAPMPEMAIPEEPGASSAPANANTIHLTLDSIVLDGATAFSEEELQSLYAQYLHKDITLDMVWVVADAVTKHYREAGYFLSRAFVPVQRIKGGSIRIRVVEGYISKVKLADTDADNRIIQSLSDEILQEKPVTSASVESFLLRLNDLPGYSFRSVLSRAEGEENTGIMLTLIPTSKDMQGSASIDNFGSRYIGPTEASFTLQDSLLPLQQTTVSGLSSLPVKELKYGTINHLIMLDNKLALEASGGVTNSAPGYTLQPEGVKSLSRFGAATLDYYWIRQRQENATLKLGFNFTNFSNDVSKLPITRDHIRKVFAGTTYSNDDAWDGQDTVTLTVTRGLSVLGATPKRDHLLSRSQAIPNFTKGELSVTRLQQLDESWQMMTSVSGQLSSSPLFSSEQFGYGGQAFGRAYDTSDISGDTGVSGAIEFRYSGIFVDPDVSVQPFGFYDIGVVRNYNVDQPKKSSGSSMGVGTRFSTSWHESGLLGVGFPLTREIHTPIYSRTPSYRLFFQVTQDF